MIHEIGDDAGSAGVELTGDGSKGGGKGGGTAGAGAGSGGKSPGAGGTPSGSGGRNAGAGGTASGSGGNNAGAGGSSGGAGQAGSGAGSELIASFAKLAAAQCAKLSECAAFGLEVTYGSENACQGRLMLLYDWEATLPDTAVNVANVDACTAALMALSCSAAFGPDQPQACNRPGTRSLGAPCNSRVQCASGFCASDGYDCGTCAAPPPAGATCTSDGSCADAMNCFDGSCLRPGQLGDTCSTTAPCGNTLACYGGQCIAAPSMVGADCDPSNGIVCDLTQGLVCAAATSTCVDATPSDTCAAPTEYCQGQKYCDQLTGSCLPRPSDSGACSPSTSLCQYPALCVAAKCELPASATMCPTRL
jgi:hypothetical protein